MFRGYVHSDNSGDLGIIQPVIIHGNKQIPFWSGIVKPKRDELNLFYEVLGLKAKDLFPLKWECNHKFNDCTNSGVISGFYYLGSSLFKKDYDKTRYIV